MSEKFSIYGHHATSFVIGGVVAYAGLIVLLGGLGILAAFALRNTRLDPMLTYVIGLGGVGLVVILAGAAMALKAIKAFSSVSIAPERTIATFKHLKGDEFYESAAIKKAAQKEKEKLPKPSPEEVQAEVLATEDHIGATLKEIVYRTSPARVKERAVAHIHSHPYTWSLAALGGGLVSSLLLTRKISSRRP